MLVSVSPINQLPLLPICGVIPSEAKALMLVSVSPINQLPLLPICGVMPSSPFSPLSPFSPFIVLNHSSYETAVRLLAS